MAASPVDLSPRKRRVGPSGGADRRRGALRVLGWVALAVLFLAGALLIRMPAGALASPVLHALDDGHFTVEVDAMTGPWWAGQAVGIEWRATTPAGDVESGRIGQLAWRWRPAALLRGALAIELDWREANGALSGTLRLGPRSLRVTGLAGQLTAQDLMRVWNGWPLVIDGTLVLDAVQLGVDREGRFAAVGGALVWRSAAAGLPQPVPLGDQRVTLRDEDGVLIAEIESAPEAALSLDGALRWTVQDPAARRGLLEVDVVAQAVGHAGQPIAQALDAVAAQAREAPDVWRFSFVQERFW